MSSKPQLALTLTTALWLTAADAAAETASPAPDPAPEAQDTAPLDEARPTDEAEPLDEPEPLDDGAEVEPPAVEDSLAARVAEHDRRTQELFTRGDYQGALIEQEAAQALMPATPRLFNMATCQERLGRLQEAIDLYWRFLEADDVPTERRAQARANIERLSAQLALQQREAEARPPVEPTPVPEPSPCPPRLRPTAFWSLIGVTIAAGVATAVVGALTLVRHDEFLELPRNDPRSVQLRDQGQTLSQVTNVLLGLTIAAAAVSLVLGLQTDFAQGDEATVTVSPGLGSVALSGRF